MPTPRPEASEHSGQGLLTVAVSSARQGGWDLRVEDHGQVVVSEHYSDWHRLERRRALLRADSACRAIRIAAMLVLAALLATRPVAAQDAPSALLPEPGFITKAVDLATGFGKEESGGVRNGFYPELGHMITGAGWISLGPGYRHHLFGNRAVIDLSTAISWRAYKIAQARFEFLSLAEGHVALGSQVLWNDLTQVSYFGAGPGSIETDRSDYRLQGSNVVAYAKVRSTRTVLVTSRLGWLTRPELSSSTGPFDRDLPETLTQFPQDPAAGLTRQPRFLHADVSLTADTRDHPGHPSHGGLYRATWVGFRDRDGGQFTFERYEMEGAHFLSVLDGRSAFALHGWGVFSTTAEDRAIPFYLLPSLGGGNTLRGYSDYRFHDRHLLVVNAESRWALFPHVDAAAFIDAGNVAPRASDLDLGHKSYGVGMRLHTGTSTMARFDMAKGSEGWRLLLRLNDPLRLARLSRRTAAAPFVP